MVFLSFFWRHGEIENLYYTFSSSESSSTGNSEHWNTEEVKGSQPSNVIFVSTFFNPLFAMELSLDVMEHTLHK